MNFTYKMRTSTVAAVSLTTKEVWLVGIVPLIKENYKGS